MPSGSVHQDHAMGLGGNIQADLLEVQLHGLCVGKREHEGGALGPPWADGAEEIGVLVALVSGQAWAGSSLGPDPHAAVLLSQPGFVLKPDFDPLGLGQIGYVTC